MSRSSQPDTTSGFAKLPTDVLLNIFNSCDVADILNLALTCKELRTTTEERHVWLAQFKKRCTPFRQAPLRSRTKELHAYSTAQLRSWAIQQARTDALWLQNEATVDNLKLQGVRINDPEYIEYTGTFLLPGGEHVVVFASDGDIILKKFERRNDAGDSEWVLADIARCSPPNAEHAWPECPVMVFTDTICEYPLVAYHDWEDASVTIFSLDYDSRTIPVQKEIQVNPHDTTMGYDMVSFGIRGDTIMWFYTDEDGETRDHLIVAKLDDPDGAATRHLDLDWDTEGTPVAAGGITDAMPRFQGALASSRFEIITANAFLRYDHVAVHLCHIPHLTSGIQQQDGNSKPPIPSLVWSLRGRGALGQYSGIYYDRTNGVLPTFHLHDYCSHTIIKFGTDTPTDAEHDSCVGYPVVLNHTVTKVNGNPKNRIAFQWSKGRKAACVGFDPAGEEFHLETMFVDDPDKCGHFRTALRQYGLLGIDESWVDTMECDEVTGRILLVISGGDPPICKMFLADLPQPLYRNSHDCP